MNEHETEQDLEFLREKLALLGEPELPPALSAAALFRRMDEGSLTLPEEEAPVGASPAWEGTAGEETLPAAGDTEAAAPPAGKVIPWRKVLRRGVPLAACLALVLLVYQGREVGLAKNFSSANQAAPAAPSSAAAAYDAAPESAEENAPLLRSYQSADAPAEVSENGQDQNTLTASGAPAPASAAQNAATEKSAAEAPADDANPDVGGGEMAPVHPDSGEPETDLNPDIGWGEVDEEWERRTQSLQAQALEAASRHAPREGLTPVFCGSSEEPDSKEIDFFIVYCDQEGREVASNQFCFILADETDPANPRLELVAIREWQQP